MVTMPKLERGTIYTNPATGKVWREVSPALAYEILSIIGPDFSEEEAMRFLFPEEAADIYNSGRWPWGPPISPRAGRSA